MFFLLFKFLYSVGFVSNPLFGYVMYLMMAL